MIKDTFDLLSADEIDQLLIALANGEEDPEVDKMTTEATKRFEERLRNGYFSYRKKDEMDILIRNDSQVHNYYNVPGDIASAIITLLERCCSQLPRT